MNCTNHHEWLQTYLDGDAPTPPETEAHQAACPACRALFAAAQALRAGLSRITSPAPPEGMPDQIVTCVLAERRRVLRFRRVAAVVALAASLLLVTFLALPFFRKEVVPDDSRAHAAPKPVEPSPSLQENLEDASAAVADLTRRMTGETVGQTGLLLPAIVPDMPLSDPQVVLALNMPAESLRGVQETVSEGLEPVTTSMRRAMDLFRRNLPPMAPSE
jgi:anti-sigma factor RsiW